VFEISLSKNNFSQPDNEMIIKKNRIKILIFIFFKVCPRCQLKIDSEDF
jgi:hypothetical protein